jgi:hypothetical protein
MTCARCGADAAVKRDNAFYCAKCAMARDWEDVIAMVQEERVSMGANVDFSANGADGVKNPGAPPAQAASATAAAGSNGDLPADPFS